jgi:chromosome segregation ATPase
MVHYPAKFKAKMVSKMLPPNPISACALEEKIGVSHASLSRRLRVCGNSVSRMPGKDRAMITEIKERLKQLAEVNSALAQDLDVSRRVAAKLGRERDSLREQVKQLTRQQTPDPGADRLQRELALQRRQLKEFSREQDTALRDAQAARTRANLADERLTELWARLHQVEQERDEAMSQLSESTSAMDEIRSRLLNLPDARLTDMAW